MTMTNTFNYAQLDSETRIVVQQRTSEIKSLVKRSLQDRIDMGGKLIEIKSRLNHGQWLKWLEAEFDWSEDTAENMMNAARHFNQIPNGSDFQARALYLLASPSTPPQAREEAIERAATQPISYTTAKEIIANHKPTPKPPAKPAIEVGQRVAVLDEESPYYGREATVTKTDGLIVEAETDEGEKLPLLAAEVLPQPKTDRPIPQPQPKRNPIAGLQSELDIERIRVELLELKLLELIGAIEQSQEASPQLKNLASEIKKLVV